MQQREERKVKRLSGSIVFILLVACSLIGCSSAPESSFMLARESRLPKWFTVPPGLTRDDVTVKMDYYLSSATFTLLDSKKRKLAEVKGKLGESEPLKLKNPPPGYPAGYPLYEIVTANGITEVIEHRRPEPIFYIVDNPAVLKELGVHMEKR
ncbi:MAG TPA: hypothetical protein VEI74_12750 [Candidatus Methylomirabilis sp.]|nr:hypothetical protein [Candidatus Methylomirabilis sp.]